MNVTTLLSDIDFLCGSTSGVYTTASKLRNINIAYNDVARIIWESSSTVWDDSNNTDGPVSYVTLGNASASYTIPTTAMRIRGIEVKDTNSTWHKLTPITYEEIQISPEEYLSTAGTPLHYMIEGNEIRLFPPPSSGYVGTTTAMAVRLERNVTELTKLTSSPGFPTSFHRILSYAAALDFTQDNKQREFIALQKERLEKGLRNYFAKRAFELPAKINPAGKGRWRQYL